MDWAGLLTFSTALFLLVPALVRGNDEGWGSTLIVSLLAGGGGPVRSLHGDRAKGRRADAAAVAAEQGFLHGLNEVLLLGAVLAFAGSVLALWLVREREIERETVGAALQAEPGAARA